MASAMKDEEVLPERDVQGFPLSRAEGLERKLHEIERELKDCADEGAALALIERRERLKLALEAEEVARLARTRQEEAERKREAEADRQARIAQVRTSIDDVMAQHAATADAHERRRLLDQRDRLWDDLRNLGVGL